MSPVILTENQDKPTTAPRFCQDRQRMGSESSISGGELPLQYLEARNLLPSVSSLLKKFDIPPEEVLPA